MARLTGNKKLSAAVGALGKFDAESGRWGVVARGKSTSVKPGNIEAALRYKSQLSGDFFHAAYLSLHRNECKSKVAFERIWEKGNETGDIDQLIAAICTDATHFWPNL